MQNLVSSGGFKWILYSFVMNDVTVIKLAQATTGAALPALYLLQFKQTPCLATFG